MRVDAVDWSGLTGPTGDGGPEQTRTGLNRPFAVSPFRPFVVSRPIPCGFRALREVPVRAYD